MIAVAILAILVNVIVVILTVVVLKELGWYQGNENADSAPNKQASWCARENHKWNP